MPRMVKLSVCPSLALNSPASQDYKEYQIREEIRNIWESLTEGRHPNPHPHLNAQKITFEAELI